LQVALEGEQANQRIALRIGETARRAPPGFGSREYLHDGERP
jgi:hypothetical protein